MKFLFYILGLGGALALGLFPSISQPRPKLTKIITILVMIIVVVLALYPPTVASIGDVVRAKAMNLDNQSLNVLVAPDWTTQIDSVAVLQANVSDGSTITLNCGNQIQPENQKKWSELLQLKSQKVLLLKIHSADILGSFKIDKVIGTAPTLMLPYIPALEERARIMYFHVPMSWVAFLAYIVTLVSSIMYLKTRSIEWELKAASSAAIGTLFCTLAYITGALWAKFNWGKFYSGDPREISVLILLLIYGAYFVLRGSVDNIERRARLTSVYAILGCVAALFLMFIVPRIMNGLHPGSAEDSNIGPIVSPQQDSFNLIKAFIFSLSLGGFTLVYFWLLNLGIRIRYIEEKMFIIEEPLV